MPKLFIFVALLAFSAHATALTVAMTATTEGGDKPTVVGTTNLPDGIELMITISRKESQYMAQEKTTVKASAFKAGPFSQNKEGLNTGSYTLEVSMPLATMQQPRTWPIIGNDGKNLQGPLVKKSAFGGKVVEYKTQVKIGNGQASAEKDKSARAQTEKESHAWWLQSCKDTCKLTQNIARQRNESFDWDRCYYKCVADEPKKK